MFRICTPLTLSISAHHYVSESNLPFFLPLMCSVSCLKREIPWLALSGIHCTELKHVRAEKTGCLSLSGYSIAPSFITPPPSHTLVCSRVHFLASPDLIQHLFWDDGQSCCSHISFQSKQLLLCTLPLQCYVVSAITSLLGTTDHLFPPLQGCKL